MPTPRPSSDHDLLIELRTQMVAVRDDIQKLGDDTFHRLSNLEHNAVNKFQFDDHESRIRSLERYLWIWMGGSGVAGALVAELVNLISGTFTLTPH